MKYRLLGRTGLYVSELCMGTMTFGGAAGMWKIIGDLDQAASTALVKQAFDAGVNFFDTANIYGFGAAETITGAAIKQLGLPRDEVVIATKAYGIMKDKVVNAGGQSRYHLMHQLDASLQRLQLDHIDLYQLHGYDPLTPLDEVLGTLDDMVRSGKVRYIGASNYMAWQLARANLLAEMHDWTPFVSIQNHYHMFERDLEREMIPYCNAHNVGILPFFPLAGGFLTGKYQRNEPAPAGSRGESSAYVQAYMTPANYDKLEALTAWAAARDHSMTELAHAWLLAQPRVSSVISGATKLSHVQSNVKGAAWALTADELDDVNAILGPLA